MVKALITIGSFLVGGAGVGVIAYMQSNPFAFTHVVPTVVPLESRAAVVEPLKETVSVAHTEGAVMAEEKPVVLRRPQVSQVARSVSRPAPAAAPAPAEAKPPVLCDWRDIGVQFVSSGTAVGTRRVRELCE